MSFRSLFIAAVALVVFPASLALAEDDKPQPTVENSKYHFLGSVNSGSVFVRSGPGEGYYPTQKLDKGAPITVVGIRFDWLKILPPDGSFCYISSAYVDRTGDGTVGRINRANVNVRAGSAINAMKTTVQMQLNQGDTVQIMGQEDEYLKIRPPTGCYLYVNKQFIDPVRAIPEEQPAGQLAANGGAAAAPTAPAPAAPASGSNPAGPVQTATPTPAPQNPAPIATATPTTQPAQVAMAPTTQPATQPSAEELFGQFEADFIALSRQPLGDQNIAALSAKYQSIAKADDLSDTLKQVVQLRIATLAARTESQKKLAEARRLQREAEQKQLALTAEQQELQERLKASDVEIFTAVGTLQPSSLQIGGGTLYRLTDPATGHTVVYIRTNDAKVTGLMGQFIGVKGDATTDSQLSLRIITPTDAKVVDPAKVNSTVAAEIIPPSLLARQASATSSN